MITGLGGLVVTLVRTQSLKGCVVNPYELFRVKSLQGLVGLVRGGHLATLPNLTGHSLGFLFNYIFVAAGSHDPVKDRLLRVGDVVHGIPPHILGYRLSV